MSKTLKELDAEYRRLAERTRHLRKIHQDAENALKPFQQSAERAFTAYSESMQAEMDAFDDLLAAQEAARLPSRGDA